MEFISPEGLRLDGRRANELRHVSCELGVLKGADGSACFEIGNTKAVAAVYGPREVKKGLHDKAIVQCEYSMARFSTGERRRGTKGDRRSQEISLVVRQTMESIIQTHLLPRTQIDIFVQVLQADGGTRCACINAATLALADAGIPLSDMAVACSAGFLSGTVLLDLNYVEDSGGGPDLTVGLLSSSNKVSLLQMDSKLSVDMFEQVVETASSGCREIAKVLKEALHERTQQLALARGKL